METVGDPPPAVAAARLSDDECYRRVRDLLPNVSPDFVRASAKLWRNLHGHCSDAWCEGFVNFLLDRGHYPTKSVVTKAREPAIEDMHTQERAAPAVVIGLTDDGDDGRKVDDDEAAVIEAYRTSLSYQSRSANTRREQSLRLHAEFPRLTKNRIGRTLNRGSLFNAYVELTEYHQKLVDMGRPLNPLNGVDLSAQLKSDGSLEDELLAAKKYVQRNAANNGADIGRPIQKQSIAEQGGDHANANVTEEKTAEPPVGEYTCHCCDSDEARAEDMVTCNSSKRHMYCHSCVSTHVQTELEKRNPRIKCFMGNECEAPFLPAQLAACVDAGQLRRLAELQQDAELEEAGLDNMHRCPACNFRAQCPPLDENSQFDCPGCQRTSCRLCLKAPHRPLTCAQYEEQQMREDKAKMLHVVAEAMSKARIRRCNYICGVNIRDYRHFDRNTCPLYDNEVPLAVRHASEINTAKERTVALLVAQHPGIPEAEFRESVATQMKNNVG